MSTETDRIFESITEPYELGVLGIRSYEMLPGDRVYEHQRRLDEYCQQAGIFPFCGDEVDEDKAVLELARQVEGDFVELGLFYAGDEVVATGGGWAVEADLAGDYKLIPLGSGRRVHSRIVRPVGLPMPSDRADAGDAVLDYYSSCDSLSVALLVEAVSYEPSPGVFESPADGTRVFLPLCYRAMQLKRRVD